MPMDYGPHQIIIITDTDRIIRHGNKYPFVSENDWGIFTFALVVLMFAIKNGKAEY